MAVTGGLRSSLTRQARAPHSGHSVEGMLHCSVATAAGPVFFTCVALKPSVCGSSLALHLDALPSRPSNSSLLQRVLLGGIGIFAVWVLQWGGKLHITFQTDPAALPKQSESHANPDGQQPQQMQGGVLLLKEKQFNCKEKLDIEMVPMFTLRFLPWAPRT
eukprot:4908594-Amphidinium_carterae.2